MTLESVTTLGTILGIWAHPDDETYLAGGVMAAARTMGQPVTCVTATAGEHGTDDPWTWPPDRLHVQRRRELASALAILDVRDHTWLGFSDGACLDVDPERAISELDPIVRRVRPDTILTFGPDGLTGHPDHRAVGHWARAVAARHTPPVRVLEAVRTPSWLARFDHLPSRFDVFAPGYPIPASPSELALDIELPDDVLARKVMALHAQSTQTTPIIEAFGHAAWREWVRTESFVDAALRSDPHVSHNRQTGRATHHDLAESSRGRMA